MNFKQIAKDVLQTEANELLKASNNINDNIAQAVELISKTKTKLIITGMGKSGHIGAKMAATFASTGTPSFFLHPSEAMHGDLGMIRKDDTILAISYSGESEEIISILPHIKRFNTPVVCMTGNLNSTLAKASNVALSIHVDKEACPINSAPTSSTTLTMAIGDVLAVCLMKKRNFKVEDFASFHPGGSLGKKLFVKVSNIMRTSNLPIIKENATLQDAIEVITEGRMGNVLICDEDQKIKAVLSDGDLRRALLQKDFSLSNSAIKYACKTPKILNNKNTLASKALEFIEKNKIQLLVITDDNHKVQGVLHLHDLVEYGIK